MSMERGYVRGVEDTIEMPIVVFHLGSILRKRRKRRLVKGAIFFAAN
jgi:hypothetical protein